ncbi:MAG: YigZ family protein [Sulfurimonas sp.]|nr:YigZ family protein [Sulfurimonas sp.]
MKYIDKIYTQTHEVKQSKFIAYLVPFSEFIATLEQLKISHPKARHFVVAYRYLNKFNQIVEHSSDDGEPKGTSGKPSLFVLQGLEMINCGVIIVRYFGGTKLGTGGLVRAYSDSVNLVLNLASFIEYKQETSITIYFEYSNIRMVEYECLTCGVDIVEKSFDAASIYKIKGIESNIKLFLEKLSRVVEVVK